VLTRLLKSVLPPSAVRRLASVRRRALRTTIVEAWRRLTGRTLLVRAERHRRRLTSVTFVAITGSTGKSSARAMIAAVLRTAGPCAEARLNIPTGIATGVLEPTPAARFCLAETAAARPGFLDPSLKVFQPHIGVVTNIGSDQ